MPGIKIQTLTMDYCYNCKQLKIKNHEDSKQNEFI